MPINKSIAQFELGREDAFEWMKGEVSTLRSGRVTPDIVDSVPVEVYGSRTPLNGLASVVNSDARTLTISPWDPGSIPAIEKAITDAGLGVQPSVDSDVIRLSFPSLTDEVRAQTLKRLHNIAEETRVRLRQSRDEALKTVKEGKEAGDITEDDFFDGRKQLDEAIEKTNTEIVGIVEKKEEEIQAV